MTTDVSTTIRIQCTVLTVHTC